MNGPTQDQLYELRDKEVSAPIPLHQADLLNNDWVYYRPWGLMYVACGMHSIARATIVAFRAGYNGYYEMIRARHLGRQGIDDLADEFLLTIPGTAFLSSVSDTIIVGKREHLDSGERAAIRKTGLNVRYLEDGTR